jgi:hypothetical protein
VTIHHLPPPVSDPESIRQARAILAATRIQLGRLPQRDATIREFVRRVGEMETEADVELDPVEPEFDQRLKSLEVWR